MPPEQAGELERELGERKKQHNEDVRSLQGAGGWLHGASACFAPCCWASAC